jgi:broad specificity phosphatase PhoE
MFGTIIERVPLKKLIYYYRHGETYYSARGMGYGNKEYEAVLTDKGRQQAALLGAEMARRGPFDLFMTSPLPRAVQTATIVQTHLDIEFQVEMALIEGMGQRHEEIWKRIEKMIERLMKSPHETILLSTHGFLCCCLSAYFRGQTWRNMDMTNPPTASFGWVELQDGQPVRGCRYSTVHLTPVSV